MDQLVNWMQVGFYSVH